MKLTDISTAKLRRIIRDTERLAGTDSVEVRILRRELDRRMARKAARGREKSAGQNTRPEAHFADEGGISKRRCPIPVVIDFAPTAAIASMADQVGLNKNAAESQQLGDDQQRMAIAQQDDALRQQQAQQSMGFAAQDQSMRQTTFNNQQQQEARAQQQPANLLNGTSVFTDSDGNQLRVTPQQRTLLQNLDAMGLDPAHKKAIQNEVLLGGNNLVPVQQQDGSTAYLPPGQAAGLGIKQGNQQIQQRKLTDEEVQHGAMLDAARQRMSAQVAQWASTNGRIADGSSMLKEETAAKVATTAAEKNLLALTNALTPDPQKVKAAQDEVETAVKAEQDILVKHAQKITAGQNAAASPPAMGQPFAGSTVAQTGSAPNGQKVFKLADGRILNQSGVAVDNNGNPVGATP